MADLFSFMKGRPHVKEEGTAMPSIWEQLFGIVIIALAMVFGGFLYRRSHGGATGRTSASATKKQPSVKRHPRKKG